MEKIKELYRLYEKKIFHYFFGLTLSYHVAEELTQETFFQVLKSFYRFRGDSQVTTWLYGIARNVYRTWRRKNHQSDSPLEEELLGVTETNGPLEILERKEDLRYLLEVLAALPINYKEVLWLREWQGLSYEEIAVITGHSLSWVKVNLHRARASFRSLYIKRRESQS